LYAEVNGDMYLLTDCIWLFQRPCECPCQVIPADADTAGAAQVWKRIYAADTRIKRRIDYAKRDGFKLSLIPRPKVEIEVYPVSELCAHGQHVANTQRVILVGERYGRLVVTAQRDPGQRRVKCRCDCGRDHSVPFGEWRKSRSCGCLRDEVTIARSTTHGHSGTSIYMTWSDMINRCTNPTHKGWANYGGRGITVCERWRKFENFLADMGERPESMTLDRINNDREYGPDNCRWADISTQAKNRRSTAYAGSRRDLDTGRFLPKAVSDGLA
jgi:hypothetical protein